ncbi:MAG: PD-(D/E)XK nuclease family protein [Leuconostoc carnosum]|uniref:PD-(D/E)XK nuclease family protein n=1 Tax=Leuconostoc carnosum TaxID=1252 RepID=UPI003F9E84DD
MSLTIYMNNAQQDLRSSLLENIQEKLTNDSNLTVYYIVPNHVKFDGEVDVLRRFAQRNGKNPATDIYAQSRLQVYSLTRLAWALMKDIPNFQPEVIQPSGLFIMVSDILRDYAQQLPVFARMQAKSGFVSALVSQLVELRASRITPEDLLQILNDGTDDESFLRQSLAYKLRDLAIVADALDKKLGDTYIMSQEVLPIFATHLAQTKLENVAFYFDSFNGFTSAELSVVNQLLIQYPVSIAFWGDATRLGQQQEGDVFYKPMMMAQQLMATARQANQAVHVEIPKMPREISETSHQLLSAWEALGEYRQFTPKDGSVDLMAFAAENTVVEIQEVARRIRQLLVQNKTLHLRDIIILSRDLKPYETHIPEVMSQFDLPYFLDTDQTMAKHPLVELLLTLLGPKKSRFQYQNVMTILKTSLLRPYQHGQMVPEDEFFDIVSYFDNYLFTNRPYEATWRNLEQPFELFKIDDQSGDDDVTIRPEDALINQRINVLRRFILEAFDALENQLAAAQTMRQAATHLVDWLQHYHVTDAIIVQRDDLLAQGELVRSRQGEEVWQMFSQTLDEIVAINGDAAFKLDQFREILVAGFSGAKFAGIPNNLDQLTISEAGIVQSNRYQYLFFIGGTRSNLPATARTTALINDSERLIVQPSLQAGDTPKYLQNTAQQQMAEENLLFYGALASATENVTLSYPILDAGGKIADMSPFFKRLVDAFNTNVLKIASVPETSSQLLKQYVGTARSTLTELVKILPKQHATAAFKALQNVVSQQEGERLARVLASPNYRNTTTVLKPEFVKALFGEHLNVSISQLESYYQNPLGYFLKYGLNLKERLTNELNVAQTGTLYHAVLESVMRTIIQENLTLRDLNVADLTTLVSQKMAEQLQLSQYNLLQETGKMRATRDYLQSVSMTLVKNLQRAAMVNQSKPQAVEKLFGFPDAQSLPPLKFTHGKGSVTVRGKIDRFDTQDTQHAYGTVIDYKSNGKTFDWGQAFDGLQMQLLTYWQAAQLGADQLGVEAIGGAFFAQIAPKKRLITDFKGDIDDLLAGKIIPDVFKYRGLFVSEDAYIDSLDVLKDSQGSDFYQLKKTKAGTLYASSDFVAADDFGLLLQRNIDNIQQAGENILSGKFPLEPTTGSLQFTPFTDVLRFDRGLGDNYRPESPKGKDNILKILKGED